MDCKQCGGRMQDLGQYAEQVHWCEPCDLMFDGEFGNWSDEADSHQWETESVHGAHQARRRQVGKTGWRRCGVCSARRQRRMTWDSGGKLQTDLVDATAPNPLPKCEGVRV